MSKTPTKNWWNSSTNIFLFTLAGIICGIFVPHLMNYIKDIGSIFIQLIRMLVIPIIFFAIINSIILLKDSAHSNKKLGAKVTIYFLISLSLAATLAVIVGIVAQPGKGMAPIPPEFLNGNTLYADKVPTPKGLFDFILHLIPSNPLEAVTSNNILQVVLLSMFFGLGLANYEGSGKQGIKDIIHSLTEVLSWMMSKIMLLTPIAVFSLMGYTVSSCGTDVLSQLLKYFLIFLGTQLIWTYLILGFIVKIKSGVSWFQFVKTIAPLQIVAMTTSSTMVSLPFNIKTTKKLIANDDKIADIVLPIGSTLHLTGTAIHYTLAAIFFGQIFGIQFHYYDYIAMAMTAVIGAASAAGIPGTSLLIASVFAAGGVPLKGLPLLFAVDRIFDMVLTANNVIGNTAMGILLSSKNKK